MATQQWSSVLTLQQTADYLQISERKAWELAKDGVPPCTRIGSQYRFSRDQLDEFVRAGGTAKEISK